MPTRCCQLHAARQRGGDDARASCADHYNLTVTPPGSLSLSYSYNGGAQLNVITSQDITQGGTVPIPASVRFGFAGSTGGSRNIHEIMCFQATPRNVSQSSAGLNQKQTAKVQAGTAQVYFAFYNPNTLAGSLTSQYLGEPVGDANPNDLAISSTINWDASCVLTGVTGANCDNNLNAPPGPTPAESNLVRVVFSWNGSSGIPFEYASLSTTWPLAAANEQSLIDSGDGTTWPSPPLPSSRLDYLRGDRSNEQTPLAGFSTTYQGVFRDRASVLGDIIDSSPTWVGPPNAPYPITWVDKYPPAAGDPMAENAGPILRQFRVGVGHAHPHQRRVRGRQRRHAARLSIGLFHCPDRLISPRPTTAMRSWPTYPATSSTASRMRTVAPNNYSDPQYGHHFDVDAPPGTGDLFYQGQWHTWLIGGLGAGGSAIYALDITNPGLAGGINFGETASGATPAGPATTVIGEWSTQTINTGAGLVTVANLNCANVANCSNNLGMTYGVPQIRRFHNGSWGAVLGNGQASASGDAGIYVMTVDPAAGPGNITFYYLSTSTGAPCAPTPPNPPGSCNGIDYTTPADLDGDHITDYVYAGDLLGNIWRFDLTSTNPANWGVVNAGGVSINAAVGGGGSPTPLFTTPGGQPITTKVVVASVTGAVNPRVLVEFGTGLQTPMTNFSGSTFLTSQQSLYGIWDWNLTGWNTASTVQYTSLPGGGIAAPMAPLAGTGNLVQQTIGGPYAATVAGTGSDYRTLTSLPVCYADTAGCTQFGWYINLVSGNAFTPDPAVPQTGNAQYANAPVVYEQVMFNPSLEDGAFVVNTTIPPATAAMTCFAAGAVRLDHGRQPSHRRCLHQFILRHSVAQLPQRHHQHQRQHHHHGGQRRRLGRHRQHVHRCPGHPELSRDPNGVRRRRAHVNQSARRHRRQPSHLDRETLTAMSMSTMEPSYRRRSGGMTLIELVIVMVIVAIMASIAIPSYNSYVLKSHRTEAKTALLDLASMEERYFSTQNVYSLLATDLGYPGAWPVTVGSGYYQVQAPVVVPPYHPRPQFPAVRPRPSASLRCRSEFN